MSKRKILEMARGALMERADYELTRIVENIMDINTPATKARKLTVTIDLRPDETRQMVVISATAKSTLAATTPIQSTFWLEADRDGVPVMREALAESPDQTVMPEVEEQAQPVIARKEMHHVKSSY